jgi:hypothetical protein
LSDLQEITWEDGTNGYDPQDLIIDRFGLNRDFIEDNGFTWIDNLTTGSGKNLASPGHKNYSMPYVQEYLRDVGERKCEANAIITNPTKARQLLEDAIVSYLGDDAPDRFENKRIKVEEDYEESLEFCGIDLDTVEEAKDKILTRRLRHR